MTARVQADPPCARCGAPRAQHSQGGMCSGRKLSVYWPEPPELYRLSYQRHVVRGGSVTQSTTWWASRRPGDGGVDWEYTTDPQQAGCFSRYWRNQFRALHGTRASAALVEAP